MAKKVKPPLMHRKKPARHMTKADKSAVERKTRNPKRK